MGKDVFRFKQFEVRQSLCAMKVGTDGTLLGAWAKAPDNAVSILDIGTGTGLIALMMAQRFPQARITAIDIDADAVRQAKENVAASPFADRISVVQGNIAEKGDWEIGKGSRGYDAIVSNPPYFNDSLKCPDEQRTLARHSLSMPYDVLVKAAYGLLSPEGLFSVVIPFDCCAAFEAEAALAGFAISRKLAIRTVVNKQPKRYLLELSKHTINEVITNDVLLEESAGIRSEWYSNITQDFYIR